jgi:hypothetical protein
MCKCIIPSVQHSYVRNNIISHSRLVE